MIFSKIVTSTTSVAVIFATMSVISLVLEIPTGALADTFGRKKTMAVAGFISVIAIILLSLSVNFLMLIIFAILFALKNTLNSGCQEALYYDTLVELGKEKDYKKILGRNMFYTQVGAVVGSLLGGFMASYSLRLPFLLTIPIALLGWILVLLVVEPKYKEEREDGYIRFTQASVREFLTNKQIMWLGLFGMITFGIGESVWHLSQIFFNYVNLPIVLFGIVAAIGSLSGAVGSILSHYISTKIGDKWALALSTLAKNLLLGISTLIIGPPAVLIFMFGGFFSSVSEPVLANLLNKEIRSSNRSTILSTYNMLTNLGYIIYAIVLGYLADIYNIAVAFRISGVLALFSIIIISKLSYKK
ncbi:MAG: MFS transporter [Candidatus Woesearchaeota archaeon]